MYTCEGKTNKTLAVVISEWWDYGQFCFQQQAHIFFISLTFITGERERFNGFHNSFLMKVPMF